MKTRAREAMSREWTVRNQFKREINWRAQVRTFKKGIRIKRKEA